MKALTTANTQTGEDEKLEGPALYLTLGLSMTIGIGLFFLLPAGIGGAAEHYLGWSCWLNNLTEGLVRLGLLVGYVWAISFMPDVKRLFMYHGAEHKTINAFEAGAELTPEVRREISHRTRALRNGLFAHTGFAFHFGLHFPWPHAAFVAVGHPHPVYPRPRGHRHRIHSLDSESALCDSCRRLPRGICTSSDPRTVTRHVPLDSGRAE